MISSTGRPRRDFRFRTTATERVSEWESHKCFGFPVHIQVKFMLHCSLLSVQ